MRERTQNAPGRVNGIGWTRRFGRLTAASAVVVVVVVLPSAVCVCVAVGAFALGLDQMWALMTIICSGATDDDDGGTYMPAPGECGTFIYHKPVYTLTLCGYNLFR